MILPLNDYKEVLHIDPNNNDEDYFIASIAEEAENYVSNFLNIPLNEQEYIELLNGSGTDTLFLSGYPVTEVSKVELYEGVDGSYNEIWTQLQLGTDYQRMIVDEKSVMLDGYTFTEGTANYRVTYKAGFHTLPYDIQNACKKLVKVFYNELKGNDSIGISSFSQNAGVSKNISFEKDEVDRIIKKIAHHRKVIV